jgi:hypothetical protein
MEIPRMKKKIRNPKCLENHCNSRKKEKTSRKKLTQEFQEARG